MFTVAPADCGLRCGGLARRGTTPPLQGMVELVACRTYWSDEAIRGAIARDVKQIVILGAGYDTRALRLATEGVTFFEVDRPQVQTQKKASYETMQLATKKPEFVSVDFSREKLSEKLQQAGYDSRQPTVFVMEGVTMYIPRWVWPR